MTIRLIIGEILSKTFYLLKYNLVLTIPFLLFLLVTGFVLLPVSMSAGSIFFVLISIMGMTGVFLAGWLKMFKTCVQFSHYEKFSDEEKAVKSLNLFKEFFPGVGEFFIKISLGMLLYLLLFNMTMLLLELLILPSVGTFESFSPDELRGKFETAAELKEFFQNLPETDKNKVFLIAAIEILISAVFSYLTMFWAQFIVLKNTNPFAAFIYSVKTIAKDPVNTFLIFLAGLAGIFVILLVGSLFGSNPIIQLLTIMLFVYVIVYYLAMTFLYLEQYTQKAIPNGKE